MAKPKFGRKKKSKGLSGSVLYCAYFAAAIVLVFLGSELMALYTSVRIATSGDTCAACQATALTAMHTMQAMYQDKLATVNNDHKKVNLNSHDVLDATCSSSAIGVALSKEGEKFTVHGEAPTWSFRSFAASACYHWVYADKTRYWETENPDTVGEEYYTFNDAINHELNGGRGGKLGGGDMGRRMTGRLCVETKICSKDAIEAQYAKQDALEAAKKHWDAFVQEADDVYDKAYGKQAEKAEQDRLAAAWREFTGNADNAFEAKYGKK